MFIFMMDAEEAIQILKGITDSVNEPDSREDEEDEWGCKYPNLDYCPLHCDGCSDDDEDDEGEDDGKETAPVEKKEPVPEIPAGAAKLFINNEEIGYVEDVKFGNRADLVGQSKQMTFEKLMTQLFGTPFSPNNERTLSLVNEADEIMSHIPQSLKTGMSEAAEVTIPFNISTDELLKFFGLPVALPANPEALVNA